MTTKQETFDTVYKHLVTQGKKSSWGNSCKYRTRNKRMCAVGCLIPDDMYDPSMEGKTITALIYEKFKLPSYFKRQESLLDNLQSVHDDEQSWSKKGFTEHGHRSMEDVAKEFNIKYVRPEVST